jgi:hypothetical protein
MVAEQMTIEKILALCTLKVKQDILKKKHREKKQKIVRKYNTSIENKNKLNSLKT